MTWIATRQIEELYKLHICSLLDINKVIEAAKKLGMISLINEITYNIEEYITYITGRYKAEG